MIVVQGDAAKQYMMLNHIKIRLNVRGGRDREREGGREGGRERETH